MKTTVVDPNLFSHFVLRLASRQVGRVYDGIVEPSGMRATQLGLLAQIDHMGRPTLRELSEALIMDLSALGKTLKPIRREGWVELNWDERDRRAKRVALTTRGMARLEKAVSLWKIAETRFEATFGVERALELRSMLRFIASEAFANGFASGASNGDRGESQADPQPR